MLDLPSDMSTKFISVNYFFESWCVKWSISSKSKRETIELGHLYKPVHKIGIEIVSIFIRAVSLSELPIVFLSIKGFS